LESRGKEYARSPNSLAGQQDASVGNNTQWTNGCLLGTNEKGNWPNGLLPANDGDFYGTTVYGGGSMNSGVIFQITAAGAYSIPYDFDVTYGANSYTPCNTPTARFTG
jgi:uncharacterized repeat protein (TIGR03803 family)